MLISTLRRAIELHQARHADDIASDFDDVQLELLPIPPSDQVTAELALTFWDSWGDAARHEWLYYPGISQGDWPRHAETIIRALERGEQVVEPVLLKHFAQGPSLWERIRALFGASRQPSA